MNKILVILLALILFTGCKVEEIPDCNDNDRCTTDVYNPESQQCLHQIIKPCLGNDICEQGEYGTSDCPDCDDKNICTKDQYVYELQQCKHIDLDDCCGNGKCENEEDYMNCFQDCKAPMVLQNLTTRPEWVDYYTIEDNVFIAEDRILNKHDVHGWVNGGPYSGGTRMHVLQIWQPVLFRETAEDFELEFECYDQDGLRLRARGDFGWDLKEKDGVPYLGIDDVWFKCSTRCSNFQIPEDRILTSKVYKDGLGLVVMNIIVNPDYNVVLECSGKLTCNKPEQFVNYNFRVEYS